MQNESHESVMRRRDLSDNIVEITHGTSCDRWLVVRRMLDASKISLQVVKVLNFNFSESCLFYGLALQAAVSTLREKGYSGTGRITLVFGLSVLIPGLV